MGRTAVAILSSDNLRHNVRVLKEKSNNAKIVAMVKANGYGHGIRSVSQHLDGIVDMLGVASIDEALALRKAFPQELSGFYTLEEMSELFNEIELYEAKPEQKKELSKIFSSLEIEKTQENYLWFSEKIMGCKIQNMSDEIQKLIPSFSEFKKEKTNG